MEDDLKINEDYYLKGNLEAGVEGVLQKTTSSTTKLNLALGRRPLALQT